MRTATPARPRASPDARRTPSRSVSPRQRARTTPTIGTPAISRPAVELDRCRSASVRVNQGTMISMHAKASMGRQWVRTVLVRPPWPRANGSRRAAPSAQRVKTTIDGDTSSTATLIIR
ncbi:hypothetical protein IPZ69_28440 [Streptomyces olivochromogenes]|nr:hypothetical protein [Streptomyces olivochromogenes]MCF3134203.1 hypothetical protein [Streptomyces olivochromogenes]